MAMAEAARVMRRMIVLYMVKEDREKGKYLK
jgi:hypothetical protein